jgi:hypothetical protein
MLSVLLVLVACASEAELPATSVDDAANSLVVELASAATAVWFSHCQTRQTTTEYLYLNHR